YLDSYLMSIAVDASCGDSPARNFLVSFRARSNFRRRIPAQCHALFNKVNPDGEVPDMQGAREYIKEKIAKDEHIELDQLTDMVITKLTEDEEDEKWANAANEKAEA